MKCNELSHQLVSLLYGEMNTEEVKKIQAHLKSCPSCQEAFQELKSTSKLLAKWEVEIPKLNFVFVNESVSRWKTWIAKLADLSWGRRLAVGIPVFAAAVLILLAVFNFQAEYREGQWNVSFSLFPGKQNGNQEQIFAQALEQKQQETLLLISKMIKDSEYRQRRESTLTLAQYAQEIERQRQEDLRLVGESLVGIQRNTEGRFHQTNDVINDLIRLTSYKLEKK